MSLLNILLEEVIVSETRVNMVVVGTSITMVRVLRLVILKKRSAPDSCSSESGDIVEVVDNTLDITAMTTEEFVTGIFVRRIIGRVV